MLKHYIYLCQTHQPAVKNKLGIERCFEKYFYENGIPDENDNPSGKEGRWIATIIRLATALARLQLSNIGPEHIEIALAMKHKSDIVVRDALI